MKWLAKAILSAGGAGYAPIAPGTWGTAVGGVVLYMLSMTTSHMIQGIVIVAGSVVLSILSHQLIPYLPKSWAHDDGRIVIDEVIGMWVTLSFIPLTFLNICIGFVLFRIFDIWKPFGIERFDKLHTNWGVIADDILAGIYSNLVLRVILVLLTLR